MRPGFGQFREAITEYLRFCPQFGATDVLFNTADLPCRGPLGAERPRQAAADRRAAWPEAVGAGERCGYRLEGA